MDFSYLSNPRGVQLPDPVASAERVMSLRDLASRAEVRRLEEEKLRRLQEHDDALGRALPGLVRGNFSQDSVARAIDSDPRIGQTVLKEADARRKATLEEGKTKAETFDKDTQAKMRMASHFGSEAAWLADHPKLSPSMIASFQKKVAGAGLQDVLTSVPFQAWSDPELARDALKQTGMMFYDIKDRTAQAETDRHNLATESNTRRGQDLTAQVGREGHGVTMRGQNLLDSRARDLNAITREGNLGKRTADIEMKLADDYRTQSKGFQETAGAINKVRTALKTADTNPGSALAAGTAFMKILDPNSVVRESELGMALNASGWFDRAANIAQVMQSGKVMTPHQVRNLETAADDLFQEAAATQRQVDAAFVKRTQDYGGDPSRVVMDLGQNRAASRLAAQSQAGVRTSETMPMPKSLPNGAEVTDSRTGKTFVVRNGEYMEKRP